MPISMLKYIKIHKNTPTCFDLNRSSSGSNFNDVHTYSLMMICWDRNLSECVEIKRQLDATEVFISDLIACSTCFGHHYDHHQELKSIIQWFLSVVFRAVVFKLLVWCGAEGKPASILQTGHITLSSTPDQQLENHSTKYHRQQPLYSTLELLMMGIVVPETCWASNKICNKNLCCIQLAFYFHILCVQYIHRNQHFLNGKNQDISWNEHKYLYSKFIIFISLFYREENSVHPGLQSSSLSPHFTCFPIHYWPSSHRLMLRSRRTDRVVKQTTNK